MHILCTCIVRYACTRLSIPPRLSLAATVLGAPPGPGTMVASWVIITGHSRGMGEAMARQCLAEGTGAPGRGGVVLPSSKLHCLV